MSSIIILKTYYINNIMSSIIILNHVKHNHTKNLLHKQKKYKRIKVCSFAGTFIFKKVIQLLPQNVFLLSLNPCNLFYLIQLPLRLQKSYSGQAP